MMFVDSWAAACAAKPAQAAQGRGSSAQRVCPCGVEDDFAHECACV